MKRSEMLKIIENVINAPRFKADPKVIAEDVLKAIESLRARGDLASFTEGGEWESEYQDAPQKEKIPDLDSKDIYLREGDRIVGLHAIGYAEPTELKVHEFDGSTTIVKTDFIELEKWGNNYNEKLEKIGRGSFRIFDLTIEHTAKAYEEEGWVRFVPDFLEGK
ncbi:MAG: hypothetical protein C5B47_00615 [Verrucomicrobia bacterium]|nr:MAG: hypothetical protein C5B47_00615 [Verrucomicrobiota bacterium]